MPDIESRFIYIPRHFRLEEFVPADVFKAIGQSAWQLMDPRIVWTVDQIREYYKKPVTINNWATGGKFQYRGFRPRDYTETAARLSDHYTGRAVDFDIAGMTADEFRRQMKMNSGNPMFKYVTVCEEGVNWIHLAVRPVPRGTTGILYIKGA